MTGDLFTGEFLVPGDSLFAVDLVQHLVPYLFCTERVAGARVIEIGCGAGHGAHHLAGSAAEVHAYDGLLVFQLPNSIPTRPHRQPLLFDVQYPLTSKNSPSILLPRKRKFSSIIQISISIQSYPFNGAS